MGLLGRLGRPVRGVWLLRRVLAELRGIRRALERQADALELAQQGRSGSAFRGLSVSKPLSDTEVRDLTEVAYVEDRVLAQLLQREDELRAILGRDPTEQEVERAYRGDIE